MIAPSIALANHAVTAGGTTQPEPWKPTDSTPARVQYTHTHTHTDKIKTCHGQNLLSLRLTDWLNTASLQKTSFFDKTNKQTKEKSKMLVRKLTGQDGM